MAGEPDAYPQLTPALTLLIRLIRRELIARQYDEMFNMPRPGRPDRSPRSITELAHPCARRRPRTADAVPGTAAAPEVVLFSALHLDSIRPMGATLSDKAFCAALQLMSSMPSAWRR